MFEHHPRFEANRRDAAGEANSADGLMGGDYALLDKIGVV
jgi:hypothetical protein